MGYYAVIPADVRYNNKLKANEKLMYGEISALSNQEGYCFATNRYFGELYGKDNSTISRWISNLEKQGYIFREDVIKEDKSVERRLYIREEYGKKVKDPHCKKVKHNNTSINNNISPMEKERFQEYVWLTEDEVKKLIELVGSQAALDNLITRLNDYIGQIGKDKYKSHYHTIRNWYNKDKKSNVITNTSNYYGGMKEV